MIEKCADQQRLFLLHHGELEGQDKIARALEALEQAKMLVQEDLDLFQKIMRAKVPAPIQTSRDRKSIKSKD